MLCDRCQKKDAKVLYTEIINGVKTEQHLCEECATNYTSFQMEKPLLNSDMTLNSLLSTLLGSYNANSTEKSDTKSQILTCKNCGTTYDAFLTRGRFGCSECYGSFKSELGKTFKRIQGAETHTGKRPKKYQPSKEKTRDKLTEEQKLTLGLQEAIVKEEYEEAARLRDLIRELKKEETNNA